MENPLKMENKIEVTEKEREVLYNLLERIIEANYDDLKDEPKKWASIQSQRDDSNTIENAFAETRVFGESRTIIFWDRQILNYWLNRLIEHVRALFTHELIHVLQARGKFKMDEEEANKKFNFFKDGTDPFKQ